MKPVKKSTQLTAEVKSMGYAPRCPETVTPTEGQASIIRMLLLDNKELFAEEDDGSVSMYRNDVVGDHKSITKVLYQRIDGQWIFLRQHVMNKASPKHVFGDRTNGGGWMYVTNDGKRHPADGDRAFNALTRGDHYLDVGRFEHPYLSDGHWEYERAAQ